MTVNRFSVEAIQKLHDDFNGQLISKNEWTHEAHLLVAISFVKKYDEYEALCRIRSGIILLNKTHATVNDGNGGYHETLTVFWTRIIRLFSEMHQGLDAGALANAFFASRLADKTLPMEFYEKTILVSAMHRAVFIAPVKMTLTQESVNFLLSNKM